MNQSFFQKDFQRSFLKSENRNWKMNVWNENQNQLHTIQYQDSHTKQIDILYEEEYILNCRSLRKKFFRCREILRGLFLYSRYKDDQNKLQDLPKNYSEMSIFSMSSFLMEGELSPFIYWFRPSTTQELVINRYKYRGTTTEEGEHT